VGLGLDIWKRSEDGGFYAMTGSVCYWVEETPMRLVMPSPEDSACLIAGIYNSKHEYVIKNN